MLLCTLSLLFEPLKQGLWCVRKQNSTILFGENGRKWLREHEQDLESPYACDCFSYNIEGLFPVIINVYSDRYHQSLKRHYAAISERKALEKVAHSFTRAPNKLSDEVGTRHLDLFKGVKKAVIGGQLNAFLRVDIDHNTLGLLLDYEVMFSPVLYADRTIQEAWNAQ